MHIEGLITLCYDIRIVRFIEEADSLLAPILHNLIVAGLRCLLFKFCKVSDVHVFVGALRITVMINW